MVWREADLVDYFSLEDALEGIEVIIHCAALVSFAPADKAKLHHINKEGTAHLVNAALYKGVRRLIHLSSVAALGRHLHGAPTHEDSKWEDSRR
ncbi:MAG: NAD-dependent epimerase/dehydratase family protein [Saprospiraceae bacterium]